MVRRRGNIILEGIHCSEGSFSQKLQSASTGRKRSKTVMQDEGGGGEAAADVEVERCPICLEDLDAATGSSVRTVQKPKKRKVGMRTETVALMCGHRCCRECVSTYAARAIQDGKTASGTLACPFDACDEAITESTLRDLVSVEDWERHRRYVVQRSVEVDQRTRRCPAPSCAKVFHVEPEAKKFTCPFCQTSICATCGLKSHWLPCVSMSVQASDAACERWKVRAGVKRCPGCYAPVEKRGGCNHMWCPRCRLGWCWKCRIPGKRCQCERLGAPPLPTASRTACVVM